MKQKLQTISAILLAVSTLGQAQALGGKPSQTDAADGLNLSSSIRASMDRTPWRIGSAGKIDPLQREARLDEIHARMNAKDMVRRTKEKESAEETFTVTCIFEGETYPFFAIYHPGFFEQVRMNVYFEQEDEDRYVFEVPAGTYDICADFYGSLNGLEGFGYLVHEDVEVKEDMTVRFSQEEATVVQRVQPLLKNGDPIQLPIGSWGESGLEIDSTSYNTKYVNYDYKILREGCEIVAQGTFFAEYCPDDGTTDWYLITNELSDKYHAIVNSFVWTKEDNFLISTSDFSGFSNRILHPYAEYQSYKVPQFVDTPLYYQEGCDENRLCITGAYWMNDVSMGGTGIYIPGTDPEVLVASQTSEVADIKTVVMPISVQAERIERYEIDFGGIMIPEIDIRRAEMFSLPAWYSGKQWEYINQNHSECGSWLYQKTEDEDVLEFPGLAPYCFSSEELTVPLGNSTPILVWATEVYERNGNTFIDFWPQAWIGRHGEVRSCDRSDFTSLTVADGDGKILFDTSDGGSLTQWIREYFSNPHEPGVLKATSIDTNILIDGEIKGKTYSTIEIDERKEDRSTPTPQMLIFKDREGFITDRFKSAEEGVIEFSAGDFNLDESENGGYYTVEEADVTVEYSPYGEDNWFEIKVEEVPEYFYMPGFGYFYRGSLANVNLPSSNNWYDLRLTLTDKAGNRTVEVISPAFKLEQKSGVQTTTSNDMEIRVENGMLYVDSDRVSSIDLYGVAGSLIKSKEGSSIDVSGLEGILLVRLNHTDGHSSVRKIIVL